MEYANRRVSVDAVKYSIAQMKMDRTCAGSPLPKNRGENNFLEGREMGTKISTTKLYTKIGATALDPEDRARNASCCNIIRTYIERDLNEALPREGFFSIMYPNVS